MNFRRILSFALVISSTTLLSGFQLSAQSNSTYLKQNLTKSSGMEMQEIAIEKLPEKIKKNVASNFKDAKIVKAYKVWHPGSKKHQYWVDVLQGQKKWSLQFDDQGNAIHKENP